MTLLYWLAVFTAGFVCGGVAILWAQHGGTP
jgi:hypothetical protein